MTIAPEIKFARASASTIAYMTYGDGPVVCAIPPMAQNVEMAWESPVIRYMFERFASFSRQIAFDKRGTGMSDRSLNIPGIDERVDELRAVMDAEEVESAWLHGLSEGGPMAIMFAATYPDRVNGLILEGTGARMWSDPKPEDDDPENVAAQQQMRQAFIDAWGTPDSLSLSLFAPSLAADPEFSTWWPKYERNAANRDALETLFDLMAEMDSREALPLIRCPVLILHRRDDRVVPVDYAHETHRLLEHAGVDVQLALLDGDAHYSFADDVDANIDEIERFITGRVSPRSAQRASAVEIKTLGAFDVRIDGVSVATSDWGSRRARTLLQRLCAARGWPVPRDELIELLWPGDTSPRLSARLSVQLSAVRRVLNGGVIADRSTVRLDTNAVSLDLTEWLELDTHEATVAGFGGEFLPDARYDDWATPTRVQVQAKFADAVHALADDVDAANTVVIDGLTTLLALDPYDERAHTSLIRRLADSGHPGAATSAHDAYCAAMAELGVEPRPYGELTS